MIKDDEVFVQIVSPNTLSSITAARPAPQTTTTTATAPQR